MSPWEFGLEALKALGLISAASMITGVIQDRRAKKTKEEVLNAPTELETKTRRTKSLFLIKR